MSVNVQHVRLHDATAVRAIIADAFKIADEWECDESMWPHVFSKACDLLAAGVVLTPQPSMPLHGIDLSQLGR